jgi:hypothetical protein
MDHFRKVTGHLTLSRSDPMSVQARFDAEEAVKGSDHWGDDLDSDIPPTRPN